MKRTAQDILNFVEDNDVKFAKLTFCDIFGNQKNVSLFASELPRAGPGHRHRAAVAPHRGPRHPHVLRHHPAQRQAV